MAVRLRSIPGLRDVLVAVYELSGWLVGWLLMSAVSAFSRRDAKGLGGTLLLGALLLVIVNITKLWPAGIAFGVFGAIVVLIRAQDISRMRAAVRAVLDDPTSALPKLDVAAKDRSPTVDALHDVATALSLALHGEAMRAEVIAARVDRDYLDREAGRCLDAAVALAAETHGRLGDASKSAALALPLRQPVLDARLARMILRAAWDDPRRLKTIAGAWTKEDGPLADLAILVSLRLLPPASRVDRIASIESPTLAQLGEHARELGDQRLVDDLVAHAKRRGPYR